MATCNLMSRHFLIWFDGPTREGLYLKLFPWEPCMAGLQWFVQVWALFLPETASTIHKKLNVYIKQAQIRAPHSFRWHANLLFTSGFWKKQSGRKNKMLFHLPAILFKKKKRLNKTISYLNHFKTHLKSMLAKICREPYEGRISPQDKAQG